MADSFQNQEFVRCQATDVLARLPARARAALRYFEVAALLRDYCPAGGPRLAGRRYWTIVVTDWHVYVLPAGTQRGSPAALLQLPLLDVADVVGEQHESGDYVSDARGAVVTHSILLLPGGGDEARRQSSRPDQPAAAAAAAAAGASGSQQEGDGASAAARGPWYSRLFSRGGGRPGPAAAPAGGSCPGRGSNPSSDPSLGRVGAPAPAARHTGREQGPAKAAADCSHDSSSVLALLTVERHSSLLYHISKSWLGAHMRLALSQVPAPGLPLWLVPNNTYADPAAAGEEPGQPPSLQLSPRPSAQLVATPGMMVGQPGEQLRAITALITPRSSSSQLPELLSAAELRPAAAQRRRSKGRLLVAVGQGSEQQAAAPGSALPRSRLSIDAQRPAQGSLGQPPQQPAFAASHERSPGMWENDVQLEERISRHSRTGSLGASSLLGPAAATGAAAAGADVPTHIHQAHRASFTPVDPGYAEEFVRLMLKRGLGYRAERQDSPRQQLLLQSSIVAASSRASSGQLPAGSSPGTTLGAGLARSGSGGQLFGWPLASPGGLLTASVSGLALQYGEFIDSRSAMDARLCWAQLEQQLLQPCGLLDPQDCSTIKELSLELCYSQGDKVRGLHVAFFSSPLVLAWLTARLTAWTAVCTCTDAVEQLQPQGRQPSGQQRQHRAGPQPPHGSAAMPLTWQEPLLQSLGLCAGPSALLEVGPTVAAADAALAHARQVLYQRSQGGSAATASRLPPAPSEICYYADPLYLTPACDIADRISSHPLYQRAWQEGVRSRMLYARAALGEQQQAAGAGCELDLWEQREPTPAMGRWQRLAARLLAGAARRKLSVLLRWLQLQLMFSEACSGRVAWLSDRVVEFGQGSGSWTHLDCTLQIAACLLQLCALGPGGGSMQHQRRLIPAGPDDLVWWCQPGRDDWAADDAAGVLYELLGVSEQAAHSPKAQRCNVVLQALLQAPPSHRAAVLRRLFMRLVCLLMGNATTAAMAAPSPELLLVTGLKYATLLLAALHSMPGASDALHQEFREEVLLVLRSPAVRAAMHELGRRYQAVAPAAAQAVYLATSRQEGPGGLQAAAAAAAEPAAGGGGSRCTSGGERSGAASGAVLVQFTRGLVDGILAHVASAEEGGGARLLRCRVADHCELDKGLGVMAHRGAAMAVMH